jgi:hypothetical protein
MLQERFFHGWLPAGFRSVTGAADASAKLLADSAGDLHQQQQ